MMSESATSSDRSRARQSHTVSRPTIAAVMAETIVGPADPRSLRSPKLTPRLNPRTRLKEGSTGITRGGFITQASIAHLEARSRAATMPAAASARAKRGSRAEADAAGRLAIVRLHRRRFRGAGFWLLDARRQSGDLLCSRALKARQFFAGEYAAGRQIELHGVQRRFFGEDLVMQVRPARDRKSTRLNSSH